MSGHYVIPVDALEAFITAAGGSRERITDIEREALREMSVCPPEQVTFEVTQQLVHGDEVIMDLPAPAALIDFTEAERNLLIETMSDEIKGSGAFSRDAIAMALVDEGWRKP